MRLPPKPVGRPQLRLVLAISLDGRLAPPHGGAAQIGGRGDRRVLEEALAWADGALLGAETLRRHGSTCLIHAADLLAERSRQGRSRQPVALVASRSGRIPDGLPFFAQPLERWLLWLQASAAAQSVAAAGLMASAAAPHPEPPLLEPCQEFRRVLRPVDWDGALAQLAALGLQRLVVLGGASLASALLAEDRIDELQLTLCPKLLGGAHTWLSPLVPLPPQACMGWTLLEQRGLEGEELLLRYGRSPSTAAATGAGLDPGGG